MSAAMPAQQPNAPIIGAYGNANNPRKYGVTVEDFRRVNKEANEEDYRHFILSDSMYLTYEKTNVERVYFETLNREPDYFKLKLPKNSFPHRTDSAFFFFSFNVRITIPAKPPPTTDDKSEKSFAPTDASGLVPTTFKFFKALDSVKITMGSNAAVITMSNGCQNYQNAIMSLLTKPISVSNRYQEYASADILPDYSFIDTLDLTSLNSYAKSKINDLWSILNADPTKFVQGDTVKTYYVPVQFKIPLTMLHPIFNHDTVIPPGLDVGFEFKLRPLREVGDRWFRKTTDASSIGIRVRADPYKCFLQVEQPHQYPNVIMSLKTKSYYFDVLMEQYQRVDLSLGAQNQNLTVNIIPSKGAVPVRMDFVLMPFDSFNANITSLVNAVTTDLSSLTFNVNFPFPYQKQQIAFNSASGTDTTADNFLKHPSMAEPFYHSFYNFGYTNFGEQHVRRAFPNIQKIDALSTLQEHFPLFTANGKSFSQYVNGKQYLIDNVKNYPNAVLLLPSDQLNQNPYPRVQGSLNLDLNFREKKDVERKYVFFTNLYYYYRIHISNGKCSIFPIDDLGVPIDVPKT